MEKQPSSPDQSSFVFNIEVLVEGKHNAAALEQLLHALNSCDLLDFRILSGVQLGKQIDQRKANAQSIKDVPVVHSQTASDATAKSTADQTVSSEKNKAQASEKPELASLDSLNYFDKITALMNNNTLIRLIVNKGLGIKLSIPCRIINMDENEYFITVYHVDEKQVYTFRLNEIEDFSY